MLALESFEADGAAIGLTALGNERRASRVLRNGNTLISSDNCHDRELRAAER